MTTPSRILSLAFGLAAVVAPVRAQSASIAATATVVTPLAVTGTAALAFGNVFQGVSKTIAHGDATSGRFSLTGFGTSQVALTFTLPATLASGTNTMPINNYDIRVNGTNAPATASALTVVSGTAVNTNLVAGNLFVFVGGRVVPAAAQAAGAYTGSIVLAAAYTGL
jgi:hypothetical protein